MEALLAALLGGLKLSAKLILIIVPLVTVFEVLRHLPVFRKAGNIVEPAMRGVVLPRDAAVPLFTGIFLGLAYGAGIIIRVAQQKNLPDRELFLMGAGRVVSRGEVRIRTAKGGVGAPIFYRDVPLMPSAGEKGLISPLATAKVPLIAWRLRNVQESRSRLLLTGMHTCANCHSFSRDGKTLGMDLDGPKNDKGLYALVDVKPRTAIRNEDVVAWSSFRGKLGNQLRVGFMSQVSPDGRHVVTTISPRPGADGKPSDLPLSKQYMKSLYYVSNFKDYRFLQVFYPTGGLLVWYDRTTKELKPLPGADDPRYVQANSTWSPDGQYLVFVRAEAKDPTPKDRPRATFANDPNEVQMQYDLYRVPWNDGRGGTAEPVRGASRNGMSNSLAKSGLSRGNFNLH